MDAVAYVCAVAAPGVSRVSGHPAPLITVPFSEKNIFSIYKLFLPEHGASLFVKKTKQELNHTKFGATSIFLSLWTIKVVSPAKSMHLTS